VRLYAELDTRMVPVDIRWTAS